MNNEHEQLVELTGTVVFLERNNGSKSEGIYPFLYMDRHHCLKIFFKGDNPFENTKLRSYDGKKVTITGQMQRSETFVIEKITEQQ